jgi:hypothetical protein
LLKGGTSQIPLRQIQLVTTTILSDYTTSTTSKKRAQDLTSWWVTVWIAKPWALEGQFLSAAKRADPPKGKLFDAVTCLESNLADFSHPLDQCL